MEKTRVSNYFSERSNCARFLSGKVFPRRTSHWTRTRVSKFSFRKRFPDVNTMADLVSFSTYHQFNDTRDRVHYNSKK